MQRWCRFAIDMVAELVGGTKVLDRRQEDTGDGILELIGEDLFEAVWARAQATFGSDDSPPFADFRTFVQGYSRPLSSSPLKRKKKKRAVAKDNTSDGSSSSSNSILLVLVPEADNPSAVPGYNYWTRPAPDRTHLSPNSDIYMLTSRLDEYLRYLGPESYGAQKFRTTKDYAPYLEALVQYAVGGEEAFLKNALQRRHDTQQGRPAGFLLDQLMLAIFEHVERLFGGTGTERIRAMKYLCRSLEKFSLSQLESYDNRELRWYFPQFDERPKPKVLSLLEAQEYWRKPAPDRTQLRSGHDVHIRTEVLESITSYYGLQSQEKSTKKYSFALIVHMLGGFETARKLGRVAGSFRPLFAFDDLVAVCSHAEEVFQVMFRINPSALIIYANSEIARYNKQQKRLARRATPKSTKDIALFHLPLNVSQLPPLCSREKKYALSGQLVKILAKK